MKQCTLHSNYSVFGRREKKPDARRIRVYAETAIPIVERGRLKLQRCSKRPGKLEIEKQNCLRVRSVIFHEPDTAGFDLVRETVKIEILTSERGEERVVLTTMLVFFSANIFSGKRNGPIANHVTKKFGK